MIWQPKLFLYEDNNFNYQNYLEIIKIKDISNFFMTSSSNPYYGLSIVYTNQHKFIILLYKIMIKMYINDDTQKKKTIIPSLGGAKDVLWVDLVVYNFWNLKTRSLLRRGSSLLALVQRGSILDDSRLDPWCFNPEFSTALPWKPFRNLNACLITTLFSYRKLSQTLLNFLKCFLPTKYSKIQDLKLKLSFLFTH